MKTRKARSTTNCSAGQASISLCYSWLVASAIPTAASALWTGDWFDRGIQAPLIHTPPSDHEPQAPSPLSHREHDFTLRHIFDHGLYRYQEVHRRLDIRSGDAVWIQSDNEGEKTKLGSLHATSTTTKIERLSDRRVSTMQSMYHTARLTGSAAALDASAWTMDEVSAPNTTDKETVLSLARMSWDAYTAEPGTGEWQDATGKFNHSQGFGWEGDSLRGHIFADKDNSTVVIAIKGTSPGEFQPKLSENSSTESKVLTQGP